jgi:predicted GNAT family acetyltransferase
LADQFLVAWSTCVEPPLTIREQAFLMTRSAYMTSSECAEIQRKRQESGENGVHEVLDLVTLKYDRSSPEIQAIRSQLVQSILAFLGTISEQGAGSAAAEKIVDEVLDRRERGRLFFIKETSGSEIAGYLYMGRETKNTVGVRHVYTKDACRGKGVAKELVGAACKWWLLEADEDKKKQAVTLFVAPQNSAAMRTYLRCGFRVEEEPWERRGFDGVSMGAF